MRITDFVFLKSVSLQTMKRKGKLHCSWSLVLYAAFAFAFVAIWFAVMLFVCVCWGVWENVGFSRLMWMWSSKARFSSWGESESWFD